MPTVVNGCGTWYYFKRNITHAPGVCSQCQRMTELKSYDVWLCAVVVFIPIFPLGHKRIIDECPECGRHLVMKLSHYRSLKGRADSARAALELSPTSAHHAAEAMRACVPLRELDEFLVVAAIIEKCQPNQPESLGMLAAAYGMFGRLADVERVLRLSLATKDDADTRERLAEVLLDQNKPEEAEPYVTHIIERGIPDRVGLLYVMAQVYQVQGKHEKALTYFRHCTEVNPEIEKDPDFVNLRHASEQSAGTAKAIRPVQLVQQRKRREKARKFGRFAAVAGVVVLTGYLTLCWYLGRRHTVHVVSGLDRAYTATIDGKAVALGPFGRRTVTFFQQHPGC